MPLSVFCLYLPLPEARPLPDGLDGLGSPAGSVELGHALLGPSLQGL